MFSFITFVGKWWTRIASNKTGTTIFTDFWRVLWYSAAISRVTSSGSQIARIGEFSLKGIPLRAQWIACTCFFTDNARHLFLPFVILVVVASFWTTVCTRPCSAACIIPVETCAPLPYFRYELSKTAKKCEENAGSMSRRMPPAAGAGGLQGSHQQQTLQREKWRDCWLQIFLFLWVLYRKQAYLQFPTLPFKHTRVPIFFIK